MSRPRSHLKRYLDLIADLVVALVVIGACVAVYRFGIMTLIESSHTLSDVQLTVLRRGRPDRAPRA